MQSEPPIRYGITTRNKYPTRLLVSIHDYCNARCKMCPYESISKVLTHGKMEWGLYSKIVDDFASLMQKYRFTGIITFCQMAEPFVEKELYKYCGYAEQHGINVHINTNAELMTPGKLDNLFNSGYSGSFLISFHAATKSLYEEIMGIDQNVVLENIRYLVQNYPKEKIGINALNYHWPKGEAKKILNLGRELGIRVTIGQHLLSRAGLVKNLAKSVSNRIAGCAPEWVLHQMVTSHNGDVLLCCNDMSRKAIIDNLREHNIEYVWNGEVFRNYLEKIYFNKASPDDFICKQCEESVPYWSARRVIKSALPDRIIKIVRKLRKGVWHQAR